MKLTTPPFKGNGLKGWFFKQLRGMYELNYNEKTIKILL